jgi:demethylmenaquinone methyltransferase/2-methoxy-6-polyprenyl-1,4-benzoquinol methylase
MSSRDLDDLLSQQISYYRARAPEYEAGALELPGGEEIEEALDRFHPSGDVLELACGTGHWTKQLLRHADTVTAVDASPEMLAIASERVAHDGRVSFVEADLFEWRPERTYDVVFFGFWISHVPLERFDSFWSLVADCLTPSGRVFFTDDAYRTPDELIEGETSSTIRRRLEDGSDFRLVKVPHTASGLERRLSELGWWIQVHQTSGPFYWGSGSPG